MRSRFACIFAVAALSIVVNAEAAKPSNFADNLSKHQNLSQYNQGGIDLLTKITHPKRVLTISGVADVGVYPDAQEREGEFLRQQLCDADVVVTGSITYLETALSATHSVVFTDYSFHVKRVVMAKSGQDVTPDTELSLSVLGGVYRFNDSAIVQSDPDYPPLVPGKHYLLFLQRLSNTPGYTLLDFLSTYLVEETGVKVVGRGGAHGYPRDQIFKSIRDGSLSDFLTEARSLCGGK